MIPVESSNIEAIGYDPATKALDIRFRSGATHRYADVPPQAHADLMASDSKGAHFFRNIRGAYESSKLDEG